MSPKKMEMIEKLGDQGIKIPQSNTMMEPETRDLSRLMRILREIIYISMDLKRFSPADQDNVQTTLD